MIQATNNSKVFVLSNKKLPAFSFDRTTSHHEYRFSSKKQPPKNYHLIGNQNQARFGAWYCEGELASSLYNAKGDGLITFNNADFLPVFMCDAGKLESVVAEKNNEDFEIRIVADANNALNHYHALKAAYSIKAKHYYLVDAPTLAFKKREVPKTYLDYLQLLIALAPIQDLSTLQYQLLCDIAVDIPHKYDIEAGIEFIVKIMDTRSLDVRSSAAKRLEKEIQKRSNFIKQFNQITDYAGVTAHECDDFSNQNILELIEHEAANTIFQMGTLVVDTRKMGAGKTNLMALRIQSLSSCAYISHRVGLTNSACKRLGLVSYQEGDREADKIGVCINSLRQFFQSMLGKPLFIDEARQVYDAILHSTTIQERKELFELFAELLEAAPFVHIADAGMNDDALAFYNRHCMNKMTHVITTQTVQHTANHWQLDNFDACYHSLLRDMKGGVKGTVACSTEMEAQKVRKYLIKNNINHKRILIITGKDKSHEAIEFLKNVNAVAHKYDVIIYTSALGCGVSLEMPEFEFAYLLCSNVLTSNESMQMLGRNRCAKDVYVAFDKQFSTNRVTDEELLREGQIQKVMNYAENQGVSFSHGFKATIIFHELDDLMHKNTAKINRDLNDFANNFLLLAQLEGRNFVKIIEEKKEKITKLAEEIKEERALEIQAAPVIDEHEYNQLKKSNLITKAQSASMERYEVAKMTGLPNTQSVPPTIEDIKNYQKGYTSILANFELLFISPQKLKELDLINYQHRNRTKCLLSRKKIFEGVLKPLLKAQDKGGITKPDLLKALAVLEKHAPELAAEFGNYENLKPVRVARIIQNFVKKFGYVLTNVGRESTGKRNRIYEIKVMEDIEHYANNRKGLKV